MTLKKYLNFLINFGRRDNFIEKSGDHITVGWGSPLSEDFVSSGEENTLVTRALLKLEEDIDEAKSDEFANIPSEDLKDILRKVVNAFSKDVEEKGLSAGVFLEDSGGISFVMQKDSYRVQIELLESKGE